MFEKMSSLISETEEFKKKLKEQGEKTIKAALKEFFQKYPECEAIRWHQYTPYFNDGDECVFRLGEVEIKLSDVELQDESEFIGSYSLSGESKYGTKKKHRIHDDFERLEENLGALEGVLKDVFGDHSEITVTKDEITVEEYEHD